MGAVTDIARINLKESGVSYDRSYESLPDSILLESSRNTNHHDGGIGKRGGTDIVFTPSVSNRVMGGFDYRLLSGSQYMVYAKNNGSVYHTNDSNVIATGMSTSNKFNFSQYDDELYICDGANIPKKWIGSGSASSITPATDWASQGYPFQMIFHPRGANFRNWAITTYGVYASKNNDGSDFADASVVFIPIYSKGGLVAAIEFNGELFIFSKTEAFRIDDTSADTADWGYEKLIFEGGVAHWRLLVQAANNIYGMTDDGQVIVVNAVFNSGDYEAQSLSRPAYIDRFLREKASLSNIDEWHCSYDRKLRAIKFFIQISGSSNNSALVYFIDRPPEIAWSIHDNDSYSSGYNASCSFEYKTSSGTWKIRTGDYSGNIWDLETTSAADDGNGYVTKFKFKPWEFASPIMWKYFRKGLVRARSISNSNFVVRIWINNVRKDDIDLSISGSGAVFDSAQFDDAVFADDNINFTPFDIKAYGYTLQLEFVNSTAGEDFVFSELLIAKKDEGVRFSD